MIKNPYAAPITTKKYLDKLREEKDGHATDEYPMQNYSTMSPYPKPMHLGYGMFQMTEDHQYAKGFGYSIVSKYHDDYHIY